MSVNQPYNEKEQLQRLARGDREAFAELYQYYQPRLVQRLAPFQDAAILEEIIQDVFLRVWVKKELLTGIRAFEGFLVKMARDRLIDLKRKQSATARQERMAAVGDTEENTPVLAMEYRELYEAALSIIQKLPPRQRRIYELRVLEDYSLDEIADTLGLTKAVVIKQLYLATKTVRAEIRQIPLLSLMLLSGYAGIFFKDF